MAAKGREKQMKQALLSLASGLTLRDFFSRVKAGCCCCCCSRSRTHTDSRLFSSRGVEFFSDSRCLFYLHTAIPPLRLRRWRQWWLFCPLPPQTSSATTRSDKPTAASRETSFDKAYKCGNTRKMSPFGVEIAVMYKKNMPS